VKEIGFFFYTFFKVERFQVPKFSGAVVRLE